MKYSEYGDPDGKMVVYFHGAPGSPEEALVFEECAKEHNLNIICFDRFSIDASLQNKNFYNYLANIISEKAKGQKIDMIGFSIGCHAAIETSLYLQNSIDELHLISAAAPLDGADFLNKMAGKSIFYLARHHTMLFKIVSVLQSYAARFFPEFVFKLLFSSAVGEDVHLSQTHEFKHYITPILQKCFVVNLLGYLREVKQYVMPWKNSVKQCAVPTQIWHGGSDNWSPVAMAKYLKSHMPNATHLQLFDNLSHYSCLIAAVPLICKQLKINTFVSST